MAKANDKSSTIYWIWLHDALALAIPHFGSAVLAEIRLKEWLAAGELPWSCKQWDGLDAEGIARLDREQRELIDQKNRGWIVLHILPSVAYHEGDPQFWRANLNIHWEENGARENATGGARALGIRISRERLRALLPEEPREGEEVHGAGEWIAAEAKRMKDANEISPDIGISEFARELERRMKKAAITDKSLRPIKWRSIKNKLREWGCWPVTSIK
jgi:hypothetical protein